MDKIKDKIRSLNEIPATMYGKDFLLTWEKTEAELRSVLLTTEILQELHAKNISTRIFESGLAVSNFRDNSTRTRFSFASAVNALGLAVQDLDEGKSQIAHGETVQETANMISFLTEVIGIRDDMYPGLGDKYQRQVIAAVKYGYDNGILAQKPVVVNLQSDLDHPTQTLADLAKLKEYFGSLENLKGKKIAMTWAYSPSYGKPLSVPQGLIGLLTRWGMKVSLAHPEGYELLPDIMSLAEKQAQDSGGSFEVSNDMKSAFKEADIVYPKSWAPLSIMRQRTELVQKTDFEGLKGLEKEALSMNARHKEWECNAAMMAMTRNGDALYQHCLPADISGVSCAAGEVSADVFNKYMKETYQQAGFKPFVIAAMILLAKVKNPAEALAELIDQNKKRQFIV
ncbi:MAG: knotted carbamoyltransferase YgeW [Candidatus Cloacimonetes bacterium]|nr:knotted carbamoyltransferase YgeW [Candidatus Cloacimonadota bacterium]